MALRGGAAEDDTVVGLTPWIPFIPDSTGTMRSAADPKASVGGGGQEVTHNARRHCGNSTVIKIAKERIYHFEGKEQRRAHQLQFQTDPNSSRSQSEDEQQRFQNFRSKEGLDLGQGPKMIQSISGV